MIFSKLDYFVRSCITCAVSSPHIVQVVSILEVPIKLGSTSFQSKDVNGAQKSEFLFCKINAHDTITVQFCEISIDHQVISSRNLHYSKCILVVFRAPRPATLEDNRHLWPTNRDIHLSIKSKRSFNVM